MSDLADVIASRDAASAARKDVAAFGARVEDYDGSDTALAVCLVGILVAAELRALTTTLDYMRADAQ